MCTKNILNSNIHLARNNVVYEIHEIHSALGGSLGWIGIHEKFPSEKNRIRFRRIFL